MREPYIYDGDEKIDELLLYEGGILEYNGVRFTGTLIYTDTTPNSYKEFKDGLPDGLNISYYSNGQLAKKVLWANYDLVENIQWYSNGQLKRKSYGKGSTIENRLPIAWSIDGILACKDGKRFYKNGKVQVEYIKGEEIIYDRIGNRVIRIESLDLTNKISYYYQKNLIKSYDTILTNPFPELYDFNSDFYYQNLKHTIFGWINQVYKVGDKKLAEDLLIGLFSHPEKDVSGFAKRLHSFIVMKKNGSKEKTYWFEGEPNSEFHKIIY